MAWKFIIHPYFERWKFEIDKYSNRLQKFMETCQMLKYTDQIYLNYEILRMKYEPWNISENWNIGPYLESS